VAEAEAGLVRHGIHGRADAAALTYHRNDAGVQRFHLVQCGGEGGGEREAGVDDADAVGTTQGEPSVAAQLDERTLQLHPLAAGLGEAAGVGDAVADARRRAGADGVDQRVGGKRQDDQVRHLGELRDVGEALKAGHAGGGPIDGPDTARELELEEAAHGVTAQVARSLRGADHRDRLGLQDPGNVEEGFIDA
jgi:hypothetical protein